MDKQISVLVWMVKDASNPPRSADLVGDRASNGGHLLQQAIDYAHISETVKEECDKWRKMTKASHGYRVACNVCYRPSLGPRASGLDTCPYCGSKNVMVIK